MRGGLEKAVCRTQKLKKTNFFIYFLIYLQHLSKILEEGVDFPVLELCARRNFERNCPQRRPDKFFWNAKKILFQNSDLNKKIYVLLEFRALSNALLHRPEFENLFLKKYYLQTSPVKNALIAKKRVFLDSDLNKKIQHVLEFFSLSNEL